MNIIVGCFCCRHILLLARSTKGVDDMKCCRLVPIVVRSVVQGKLSFHNDDNDDVVVATVFIFCCCFYVEPR